MERRRTRWAIFAASVISADGNPDAYLLRALGRVLVRDGHEVTFYEERGNPALQRLLRHEGARGLDAFRTAYPDIIYRTIERRAGADLVEWLTRTLATADVALVQPGAPEQLATWVGRLTRRHLRTYLLHTGWSGQETPQDIAVLEPSNFSGIFTGPSAVHNAVPSDRLRRLDALPDPEGFDDSAAATLLPAAEHLVAQILAELDQGDSGAASPTPSAPHGRGMEESGPVTH